MNRLRLSVLALCAALALPAFAQDMPEAPHETLREIRPGGESALVLRYIVTGLPQLGYAGTAPWMDALCLRDGLPAWSQIDAPRPTEILIVLMDRFVPRGQPDPEATQYIAAYLPDPAEGTCQWL